MRTGSHVTYFGPGRVSISRGARGVPAGFRFFPVLAPGDWFKTTDKLEYERLYAAQLAKLNPEHIQKALHQLAGGHEPILMCWEKPPFTETNFCHRRLVAAWLEANLGIQVSELEAHELPPKPPQTPKAIGSAVAQPVKAILNADGNALTEGGSITVVGSKGSRYEIRLVEDKLSCSCPSWKFSQGSRWCKHLQAVYEAAVKQKTEAAEQRPLFPEVHPT